MDFGIFKNFLFADCIIDEDTKLQTLFFDEYKRFCSNIFEYEPTTIFFDILKVYDNLICVDKIKKAFEYTQKTLNDFVEFRRKPYTRLQ